MGVLTHYSEARKRSYLFFVLLLLVTIKMQEASAQSANLNEILRSSESAKYDSPIWSPDGRKIIFGSSYNAGSENRGEIYSINPDGTGRLLLAGSIGRWNHRPKISPSGEAILYDRRFIDGKDDQGRFVSCEISCPSAVCLMTREGIPIGRLPTEWRIYDFSWAPGGNHILFTEGYRETEGLGVPRLKLADSQARSISELSNEESLGCGIYLQPCWSPRGDRIAYISGCRSTQARAVGPTLVILGIPGLDRTEIPVVDDVILDIYPIFGMRFVSEDLIAIPLKNNRLRLINSRSHEYADTIDLGQAIALTWLEDGRIAYVEAGDIWTMDYRGGRKTRLTASGLLTEARNFAVSPLDGSIAFVLSGGLWVLKMGGSAEPSADHTAANAQLRESIRVLFREIIDKIESDIDVTARAFADAHNLQRTLAWADVFGAGLNWVVGTLNGVSMALKAGNVSDNISEQFLRYEMPLQLTSGLFTLDSLIQSDERLTLAIDGPDYHSRIANMLEDAYHDSSTRLFFNYDAYCSAVKNHLLGVYRDSPLSITHRYPDIARRNMEFYNTFHGGGRQFGGQDLEKAIRERTRYFLAQMETSPLSKEAAESLAADIDGIMRNISMSRLHQTDIRYSTYLEDRGAHVPVLSEMGLGNIAELERARSAALGELDGRLRREQLMTVNKAIGGIMKATAVYLTITFPSSGIGGAVGQVTQVFQIPAGIDLSERIMKTSVYRTNPREQVNMIPQEMVFVLSKELSDLWTLADDVINRIEYESKKTLADRAESVFRQSFGPNFRLANQEDLSVPFCRSGAYYQDFIPYLISGDFNCDSRFPDVAFLVMDSAENNIRLAVLHEGEDTPVVLETRANVDASLIRFVPRADELHSPYEKSPIKMLGPGIEVVLCGTHSHMFYWDGRKYARFNISD